jgi:hypothetical protein
MIVGKIAFISGESLMPLVLLNLAQLILDVGDFGSASTLMYVTSTHTRLTPRLRPIVSVSPSIFAHALLTALTS